MEQVTLKWSAIIIASAVAAEAVVFLDTTAPVRSVIILWFLLICPGMAFVQLLRIGHFFNEVVLAVGLSLAVDLLVAMAVLYAGFWFPDVVLMILVVLSLTGVLCQLFLWHSKRIRMSTNTTDFSVQDRTELVD